MEALSYTVCHQGADKVVGFSTSFLNHLDKNSLRGHYEVGVD